MTIQLGKAGLVADRVDIEELRGRFERAHSVLIPGMLDPQLLTLALSYIEQGQWRELKYERWGYHYECVLAAGAAVSLLHFISNEPRFLETIGEITGLASLTWFQGTVYRMKPGAGHTSRWHDDSKDGRLVGMSLNLSPRRFQGGLFQMRERKSRRMLAEIANTGPGDAVLFRISKDFEHHVTSLEAGEPKTAFAGWFSAKQSLRERLSRGL
jgi:hypothetical protein